MSPLSLSDVFLQSVLWGLIAALLTLWVSRSRLRYPVRQGLLAFPHSIRVICLFCLLVSGGIGALLIFAYVQTSEALCLWVGIGSAILALVLAPITLSYFTKGHEVSDAGLTFTNFVGRTKHLRWSDLRSVRYSPEMNWFRLETQSGMVARVSTILMGLPDFAHMVLRLAPRSAIDPKTLTILEATAAGRPPPLTID